MKSDNVQLPRLGYKFDSVFTLVMPNASETFKIKFNPAPTIVAEIFSPEPITITGARTVTDGYYTYVLGSKIAQLGTINDRNEFEPAEDWTRYRCVGYAAQSMWVGREIDKAGTCYIARQNEAVDKLENFNPTIKQDSIYTQAWKTISVTGQHKVPVYNFQYAESADSVEDTNTVQEHEITVTYPMSWDTQGGYTGFKELQIGAVSTVSFGQLMAFNAGGTTLRTQDAQDTFVKFLTELEAAYDVIQTRTNGSLSIDVATDYNFMIEVWSGTSRVKTVSSNGRLDLDSNGTNMTTLAGAIWDRYVTAVNTANTVWVDAPPVNTILRATGAINFIIRVPHNYKRTQANIFTRNVTAAIRADELDGLFTDSSFAEPVMQFNMPSQGLVGNGAWQFIHTTHYELVVSDDSALGNFAIAEKETPINTVNIVQNAPLQQVMQSLPPAVVFDAGELDSTAKTELSSRGILSNIATILGPVVGSIFPQAAPFIAPVAGLASALDTALNI